MDQNQENPKLLDFYFGESASYAHHLASRRLRKWSRGFDAWLAERKSSSRKDTLKHILLAWKRLVRHCSKLPWQLIPSDIDQHIAWLRQEGFAESTINGSIGFISSFYQWVDRHRLDPACPLGFNPAKDTVRTRLKLYHHVPMWSLAEVYALLDLLHRDESLLGKRDYAFFLARLSLGVPLAYLQRLEWGQVDQRETGVWVRWRPDGHYVQLPAVVWQAVVDYLQASGRLDGMSSGKFIFTPQVQPVLAGSGTHASDWLEGHHLSSSALDRILKLYGRQLGIAEARLTFAALRRAAIRLRLNQGESLEGMQSFLDTRETLKSTRYRLARFPELSAENTLDPVRRDQELSLPVRVSKPLVGDEGTTHGFYSSHHDMQAVRAIMAENIHGMDREIACLRQLMQGLLECPGDEARLVQAYSQAAGRLANLVAAAEAASMGEKDTSVEEFLRAMDRIEALEGRPPISPSIREHALGVTNAGVGSTGLVTEVTATIRLLLRNVYSWAMQEVDTAAYLHLVDLYGLGCVRLGRFIKRGGGDESERMKRYIQEGVDEAIQQLTEEWHLGEF